MAKAQSSRLLALAVLTRSKRFLAAAGRTAIFVVKILPMMPSHPVDWITPKPIRESVQYPSRGGLVEGEVARPDVVGPYPGIVVCLGVVPFGVEHPQVPRLQEALARSGFAALLYWSPAMRDFRLDPADIENLSLAYEWLVSQPYVDASHSGLLGTCVGGAFALMAAAQPMIRGRVAFVGAFAPYASMQALAEDVATATRLHDGQREPWAVDPLTRKVFVHCLTADLESKEATLLREALAQPDGKLNPDLLSPTGQLVYPLLTTLTTAEAETALRRLPPSLQRRLELLSPVTYLADLRAPVIALMHDRDDPVIPITETERLRDALANRTGVRFTNFMMFKHLDPTKVRLRPLPLLRELGKFYLALYPMFRRAAG